MHRGTCTLHCQALLSTAHLCTYIRTAVIILEHLTSKSEHHQPTLATVEHSRPSCTCHHNLQFFESCRVQSFESCWVHSFESCWVHSFVSCWVQSFESCWVQSFESCWEQSFESCWVQSFESCWVQSFESCWVQSFESCWVQSFERLFPRCVSAGRQLVTQNG